MKKTRCKMWGKCISTSTIAVVPFTKVKRVHNIISDCVGENGTWLVIDELEGMWKEAVMT